MEYSVILLPKAEREIKKLSPEIARKIVSKMLELKQLQFPDHSVRKLEVPLTGYRKRIGDYRVLFTIQGTVVEIQTVMHRKDVYR